MYKTEQEYIQEIKEKDKLLQEARDIIFNSKEKDGYRRSTWMMDKISFLKKLEKE